MKLTTVKAHKTQGKYLLFTLFLAILILPTAVYSGQPALEMATAENLDDLRENVRFNRPADGDVVFVKGHSFYKDGGEGIFIFRSGFGFKEYGGDDDGIIIKPAGKLTRENGRWLRSFEGPINVAFYGVRAGGPDKPVSSKRIQRAIDFAATNLFNDYEFDQETPQNFDEDDRSGLTRGNTVYIPNGNYFIDNTIIMKDGVRLEGDTRTMLLPAPNARFDYFFKMAKGKVFIEMERININGQDRPGIGGMFFKAVPDCEGCNGGLQKSSFKKIHIFNVQGHGIHLEGSDSMNGNHRQPNQLNVFEQVNINRKGASTNCLRMTQYQGQHTFINCAFLAPFGRKNAIGGTNVHIKNPGGAVVSFINCTFQEAEYGVDMEHASNITFDNCWFENLYKSVEMKNCQNVNIINSRFANACGYGGPQINPYKVNNGDYGYCMGCTATSLNVERNYVLVSRPNTREAQLPYFIVGKSNRANDEFTNHNAIVMRNNNFQHPGLERSKGIAPDLRIEGAELTLTHQKAVNVVLPESGQTDLERINSSIGHGEMVVVRLLETEYNSQSRLVVSDRDLARSGNLLLGPDEKEIVLGPGNILTFLRVEGWKNDGNDLYQLISIN